MAKQVAQMMFALATSDADTLELDIYDTIGESMFGGGISAKSVREKLKASKAKTIKLRINSRGGDVIDGFAIFEQLQDHPARVEADVDGVAASMASVILMSANHVRMAPSAKIMIHEPWGISSGGAEDLRKHAALLDTMRDQIVSAYHDRTGLGRDELLTMMRAEKWLNAEEAVAKGFADEVTTRAKKTTTTKALGGFQMFAQDPKQTRHTLNGKVMLSHGKSYAELSGPEKAALKRENPEQFAAMRQAGEPKTFAEMSWVERVEFKRADPEKYARMSAGSNEVAWFGGLTG